MYSECNLHQVFLNDRALFTSNYKDADLPLSYHGISDALGHTSNGNATRCNFAGPPVRQPRPCSLNACSVPRDRSRHILTPKSLGIPRGTLNMTVILPNMRDGLYTCRRVESQCERRIGCRRGEVLIQEQSSGMRVVPRPILSTYAAD